MKTLLTIIALFFSVALFAQDTTFVKRYFVDAGDVYSSRLAPNFKNGVVLGGDQNKRRGIIMNTDSLGNILWNKTISASNLFTRISDIITSSDSSFVISGYSTNNDPSNNTIFCAKLNLQGDTIWTRSFAMSGEINYLHEYVGIEELSDSNYVLVASRDSDSLSKVIKLSPYGSVVWQKKLGGQSFKINGITPFDDDSFLLGGYIDALEGGIVKISLGGDIQWSKKYKTNRYIHDVLVLHKEIYCLHGDADVIKLDSIGEKVWSKSAPGYFQPKWLSDMSFPTLYPVSDTTFCITASSDYQSAVSIMDTNGLTTTADYLIPFMPITFTAVNDDNRVFIVGNGPVQPIKNIPIGMHSVLLNTGYQLKRTKCANAYTFNPSQGPSFTIDTIEFTVDADSSLINLNYTLMEESLLSDTNCIETLDLNDNKLKPKVRVYPNITSGKTNFQLSKTGKYQVQIIDIKGNEIGSFEINGSHGSFDLSNQASGIYLYKVYNENTNLTGKIIKR